jgi:multidrug efflux system membrane fusion protein
MTVGRKSIFFLALAVLSFGCSKSQPKRGQPPTPVRVTPVARIDAPINVLASGVVEPMQTVSVTAQVSGSLLDVAFKEGQVVQKGQVLFHIDPRPLQAAVDQARAALARDEANAAASARDDERYKKLADMGYVSRSQSDQAHATAVAQAATAVADRAALRSAEVNLGFATIRAPISGRTGSLLVRAGNNVGPSSGPLIVINQLSPVLVRFPVLQQDFDALQRALSLHPLTVLATSSDSTPTTEHGTLSFLDNAVDSLTGTVTGKATFANAQRLMWPGELVFLTVQLDVQHGVLAVPTDAVLTGQQGPYVYVVDQKGTAQMRNVATGIQVADMTVIPHGLAAGERVVIDGQSRLNPGGRVAVMKGGDTSSTGELSQAGGDVAPNGRGTNASLVTGRAGASGSAAATRTAAGSPVTETRVAPMAGGSPNFVQSPSAQTQNQVTNSGTQPSATRTPTGATNATGTGAAPGTAGAPGATGTSGTGARPPGTATPTTPTGRPPGGTAPTAPRTGRP